MDLTEIFDLIIDIVVIFEDTFNDLRITIFDKSLSFVDIICVAAVYALINYIVYGKEDSQ